MKNRRLKFKVKNDFQNRFILEIILVTFIFINSMVVVSFVALESIRDFYQFKFILAAALASGEAGGLCIIYYFSLRSSHRIAGPVYILERGLNAFISGDFTYRVNLRTNDYLQDTAVLYNYTAIELGSKLAEIAATVESLKIMPGHNEAAAQVIEQLHQQIAKFKVNPPVSSATEQP